MRSHSRVRPFALGAASTLAFLVGIAGWSPSSQADTTAPACASVGPKLTDYTDTLTLPKFDPSLGTLQTVTISGTSSMQGRIRVENTSATADTVGAEITYQSELVLPGGQSLPSALTYAHTQLVPAFDGTLDFAGSGFDTGVVPKAEDLAPVVLLGADTGPYVGPGTFDSTFQATGKTKGFGSGNQVNRIIIEGGATVCVSYSYAPAATTSTSTSSSSTTSSIPTSTSTTSTSSTSTSSSTSSTTVPICTTTTTEPGSTTTALSSSTTAPSSTTMPDHGCGTTTTTSAPTATTTTTVPICATTTTTVPTSGPSTTSPSITLPATTSSTQVTSTTPATTTVPTCQPTTTPPATSSSTSAPSTTPASSTEPGSSSASTSTSTEPPSITTDTEVLDVSTSNGSSPTTPTTSSKGNLPRTGTDLVATLLIGLGLVGIGGCLLGLRRGVSSPACEP